MKSKFVITLILLFFTTLTAFTQTVDDKPIAEIDTEYAQIVGIRFANKVTVKIDFGQGQNIFSRKDAQPKDENGIPIKFNSMIDALNFMSTHGFEYVNAHTIKDESQSEFYYMLKRKQGNKF